MQDKRFHGSSEAPNRDTENHGHEKRFDGPVDAANGFVWGQGYDMTVECVTSSTRISSASLSFYPKLRVVTAAWMQFIGRPGAQLSASGVGRVELNWTNSTIGATIRAVPWRTSGSQAPSSSYGATVAIFALGSAVNRI
jgi:hypothetical protein